MIARTRVAASASSWVRDRLSGAVREATVVHSGSQALYVAVLDGPTTRCVGLLTRSAAGVPCGLRTTWTDLSALSSGRSLPVVGDVLHVGDGCLSVGDLDIGVMRVLDTTVPAIDAAASGAMAAVLRAGVDDRLDAVRVELSEISLTLLAQGDPAAVPMLLGRGSGLTPVGDDVVAGWLATLRAGGVGFGPVADRVAVLSAGSTTMLSATLLERAAHGDVLPEFQRVLLALRSAARPRRDASLLAASLDHLLGIGHTSGAGMVLGCLLALDHLSQNQSTSRSQ